MYLTDEGKLCTNDLHDDIYTDTQLERALRFYKIVKSKLKMNIYGL